MDKSSEERPCKCGHPARWIFDPHYPVEFDEQMNEYHLVRDGARAVMRYCFWCGGRLPESKRGMFFTMPDKAEMDEIHSLLANTKSLADVFRILGPPDETLESPGSQIGRGRAIYWERTHRYSTRWKSLHLDFADLPDGPLLSTISGRQSANPKPMTAKRKMHAE